MLSIRPLLALVRHAAQTYNVNIVTVAGPQCFGFGEHHSHQNNNTTSARCILADFSAGFLGLGRPTALALLAFSLQLAKVFRAALGDLLPTLPSKLDGGGIFFLRQNSEGLALISYPYYA
jgi:hypothetical protein